MKTKFLKYGFTLIVALMLVGAGCSSSDNKDKDGNGDPSITGCFIELFDGDNFKDDSIKVEGPAEYADLDNLPNSNDKNWTDEADSFKVGPNTRVTVWTQRNFEGESTQYEEGEYPSVDEPYSLKIECIE